MRDRPAWTFLVVLSYLCGAAVAGAAAPATAEPTGQPAPGLTIDVRPGPNPWTHLRFRDGGGDFQFAVVSDNAGAMRPGVFARAVRALNLLQPRFVMSVGDFINGYRPTPEEINAMWDAFLPQLRPLEPPFFFIPGNHDIGSAVMRPIWHERFGRAYYHFVYRDVLFLCLNSNDRNPYKGFAPEQVEYATRVLNENASVRWTFVFLHRPVWTEKDAEGWTDLEPLLAKRKHTVFCGHTHQYLKEQRNGGAYYTLSVTGGGNQLRGPVYGDFDHVAWVTMTDAGPKIANIDINAVHGDDVRTPQTRTIAWSVDGAARFLPLRLETETFAGGTATLRLRNASDLPVRLAGAIRPHPSLIASPRIVDARLPARSKESLEVANQDLPIELQPARAVHLDDLRPLVFEGTAIYQLPDGKDVKLPIRSELVIDQLRVIPGVGPVAVDGRLDEWAALSCEPGMPAALTGNAAGWTGAADASAKLGVSCDREFLYVAVNVTDDSVVATEKGDAVELWLDARPDGQRLGGIGNAKQQRTNCLRLVISPRDGAARLDDQDPLPKGVRVATSRTAEGYAVEASIPATYLDEAQKRPWRDIRLNLCVRDADAVGENAAGENAAELWWRPDWRSKIDYPGSGTFRRSEPAAEGASQGADDVVSVRE